MAQPLINRVANSGLITLNLEKHFPTREMVVFDLKDFLFMEMILKEKDFRQELKNLDWSQYEGKIVLIHCSADAIIPIWAYMLISSYTKDIAHETYVGTASEYLSHFYQNVIQNLDTSEYENERIVIKGCSDKPVPPNAYQALTSKLRPIAKSIMFGEPCSTVPIYKQKK